MKIEEFVTIITAFTKASQEQKESYNWKRSFVLVVILLIIGMNVCCFCNIVSATGSIKLLVTIMGMLLCFFIFGMIGLLLYEWQKINGKIEQEKMNKELEMQKSMMQLWRYNQVGEEMKISEILKEIGKIKSEITSLGTKIEAMSGRQSVGNTSSEPQSSALK